MTGLWLQDTWTNMGPSVLLSSGVSEKSEGGDGNGTRDSIFKKQSKYGRVEASNTGRERVPESAILKVSQTPGFLAPRSIFAVLHYLLCSLINNFYHAVILKLIFLKDNFVSLL